jgi:hypothetical protein
MKLTRLKYTADGPTLASQFIFQKTPMKKSGFHLTGAALVALGSSAVLSLLPCALAQPDTAFIFENYDKNPTGPVFPDISNINTTATFTGGYGLAGRYISGGTAYNNAFQVVDGGLQFGALAPTASGKKLRASGFNSGATAMFVNIDGGRAAGDTAYDYYHRVYCSYLINFSQISTLASARAEVRIGGNSTSAFEMHADGPASPASTALAQPRLGYQLNNFKSAPSPATQGLALNATYLMVGRFTEVGNFLGGSGSFNYAADSNRLVLPSNATAFPSGLEVGHLIKGDSSSGIPDHAIVTGLLTTTEGGVTTRTVLIDKRTTAASPMSTATPPVPVPVALSSAPIVLDRPLTTSARTTAGSTTLSNLPTGHQLAAGQLVIHANVPPGTVVVGNPAATSATLSNAATVTVTSDITVTHRNISPVLVPTLNTGSSTITVDRIPVIVESVNTIPGVRVGQLVEGSGIDADTVVTGVDPVTRVITLSKPTVGSGSNVPVKFFARFAKADMWALTEAQYTNFISAGGTDNVLDAATIGGAANQVTLKISGTQAVGSWEFNQGKRFEIVAHGSSGSPQTFFLDEIRYGWNIRAVTRNTPYLTPPASEPQTAGDDMNYNFVEVNDDGFGWKSGWYELEETLSTPGAYLMPSLGSTELVPGGGRYLWIVHRPDVGADQGTRRRPDPAVVDMSQPYTVKFLYSTISGGLGSGFGDRIQIGADGPSGAGTNVTPNPSAANNTTWLVGVQAGDDGSNRVFSRNPGPNETGAIKEINRGGVPHWYFYDFDEANFINPTSPNYYVPTNMQSSGVPYKDGNVYSFQIEVNSLNYTYKATVTDLTDNRTGTVENLKFRRQAPAHTLFWGISKPAGPTRTVGLDALRISQGVPYVDPFPAWAARSEFGVPTALQGRNADANGDGRPNFLHFALDGNPMSGARNAKEIHAISNVGGTNYYTLTIPVRTGATFSATNGPSISTQVDGITYRIQGSYDLTNWTTGPDVLPLATPLTTTPPLSSGWEYKSFRLSSSTTAQPKAFIRAVVDNAVSP